MKVCGDGSHVGLHISDRWMGQNRCYENVSTFSEKLAPN